MLHSSYVVTIDFDENSIFKKSVLLIASLHLNPAVETSNLLNFCNDQITFAKMFSHMKFILLDFAPLDSSRQVYRCEV